jgi:hypothetical protein
MGPVDRWRKNGGGYSHRRLINPCSWDVGMHGGPWEIKRRHYKDTHLHWSGPCRRLAHSSLNPLR